MTAPPQQTLFSEMLAPTDEAGLADAIRRAAAGETAVYPIGGGTAPQFRRGPQRPGVGISTQQINRLVDHAAEDMTITVEAGMPLAELQRLLASRSQRLPIDICRPGEATVGGLAATNYHGPRRYGCGTMRDYVLGLRAVDGHGQVFAPGGRVVKNAAGYNLCRMMVGSLGTLGVLTQVTLMVRPVPEASAVLACDLVDLDAAEAQLAALVDSRTRPVSIDLQAGARRSGDPVFGPGSETAAARLLVGFEGSRDEVEWMMSQLREEWAAAEIRWPMAAPQDEATSLWQWLTEFPAQLRIDVRPRAVIETVGELLDLDPEANVEAHAGDGIIRVRLSKREPAEWSGLVSRRIRPLIAGAGGSMVVLSAPEGTELSHDAAWGPADRQRAVSRALKKEFDSQGILNPGQWGFDD